MKNTCGTLFKLLQINLRVDFGHRCENNWNVILKSSFEDVLNRVLVVTELSSLVSLLTVAFDSVLPVMRRLGSWVTNYFHRYSVPRKCGCVCSPKQLYHSSHSWPLCGRCGLSHEGSSPGQGLREWPWAWGSLGFAGPQAISAQGLCWRKMSSPELPHVSHGVVLVLPFPLVFRGTR